MFNIRKKETSCYYHQTFSLQILNLMRRMGKIILLFQETDDRKERLVTGLCVVWCVCVGGPGW